ncbi:MAG: D,D-dipeptide ABC transporter permease [Thermoprotei archaeon]|nr:MAG: D,D-dipeptide ABC transporter permease [Thermoprotei archaeon]
MSVEVARRLSTLSTPLVARLVLSSPTGLTGAVIVAGLLILALIGPALAPYDPYRQDMSERLMPPSWEHPFGTDQLGRDILSRVLYGCRISLSIAFLVVAISATIGLLLGLISGYFGGLVDEALMRVTDLFFAFPRLILAMAVAAALGPSIVNTMLAIATVSWPVYARLVRACVLQVRSETYIEAARAIGAGHARILFKHVLPMVVHVVLVQATLDLGSVILLAAGLSFIGLGAPPPTPEWGLMVSEGRLYIRSQWWVSTFPGLAIMISALGFNMLGDALRDAFDVRLRR